MITRFIAWWVRNATNIGPVATCVSAIAALVSVRMVIKTFNQARKDKKEERVANRPTFKIVHESIVRVTAVGGDNTINPFYKLRLSFENQNPNPATLVSVHGMLLGPQSNMFLKRPAKDLYQTDVLSIETEFSDLKLSDKPYSLHLSLLFKDTRTGALHEQSFWRQFFYQGEGDDSYLEILDVDRRDVEFLKQLTADAKDKVAQLQILESTKGR